MKRYTIFFTILLIFIFTYFIKSDAFYYPPQPKIDLTSILNKPVLSDEDYETILNQTGIYRPIVDELKGTPAFKSKMLMYQRKYYSPINIIKTNMSILTRLDKHMVKNRPQKAFTLAPYKNGYIFFTKSTYTFNWRHGHCGIVVDDLHGYILESFAPGTVSSIQPVDNWEYFTTFKMMRPMNQSQQFLDTVASRTFYNLSRLPYNILAMKHPNNIPPSTHCSHIIWQAYLPFNLDLDSNGGIFVSPQNIAQSPLLEPLQVFGFNPDGSW
ncbi:MAG: hypothetical protein ATN31_07530 [Candidatus Epulonipiscioides saccharophilum]|nr:MAG: hypothetical protein ATN31_07530 [Epulopiscium sp. AS2M-Bin001]